MIHENTNHARAQGSRASTGGRTLAHSVCIALAVSASSAAVAAEPTASLVEIVVTASRREEKLGEVAMGVTALTGDDLAARQAAQFADYAALVPGLAVQQLTPTYNRVIIRGLNTGSAGATVGVYVDDSPTGSSTALASGSIATTNADTWDLQRVEVLRGPQGTLYGANTQGGLIKFVSNGPVLGQLSGRVQVAGETIDGGGAGGSVKGIVNLPLGSTVALRLSGTYDQLPGFIDNPQRGIERANEGRRQSARLAFLWQPSDFFSARLTAFDQKAHTGARPAVDVVGSAGTYGAPPANVFDSAAKDLTQRRLGPEPFHGDVSNAALHLNWQFPGFTLTSISSFSESDHSDITDVSYAVAGFVPPTSAAAPLGQPIDNATFFTGFFGEPAGGRVFGYTNLDKLTQELRIASTKSDRWEWQFGAFYTNERARLYQPLQVYSAATFLELSPKAGETDLRSTYEEYAAFGDVTYKFNPAFDVSFGMRYARNKQTNQNFFSAGFFTGGPFTTFNESDEAPLTYSFAPRWHVSDDTLVYARYATGYRPGGPNNITTIAPLPPDFPRQYDSDKTQNIEVGLRTSLLEKRVSIDVAAFYVDWTDIQLSAIFGNFSVRGNGGKARTQGFEWTLAFRPVTGLNLSLNGAYIDAALSESATTLGAKKGDELPYVPRVTATFDAEYRWPLLGGEGVIAGTYSYLGRQYSDFGALIYTTPHIALPSYDTLALRAGFERDAWRFDLYARNLTDERGITSYSNSGGGNFAGIRGIIQPRTIGVSVQKRFE
jgi:outer membrane receptor protein involved in Fe transport